MTVWFVIAVAVLLGLLLFVLHSVRRPGGSSRWQKRLRVGSRLVLLLMACLAFWAFFVEPNRLIVREETIRVEQLPPELDGLRIAVLSDIHAGGSFIDERKLRTIVERTNQLKPEMIVILGDYIAGDGRRRPLKMAPETFAPILKDFSAPLGVYSVLGNHDWWFDGNRVRQALEQNGIKVLDNEAVSVQARGTTLWIVGFADLWTRPQRIDETVAQVPQNAPVIALAHNPDMFPKLPQHVPLLLGGHTHGGQVSFPFIGSVVHPSDFGQRYARGHVVENGHHLFVTSGIGTSIMPVRFGVPPEIVLLTVKTRQ
ncbi:MAG TPA: metallophosphoesterase [Pyrinomonadaceae bacterium]|nr:metallophosphoesterase [Pyrinomonadaceae bacterium]